MTKPSFLTVKEAAFSENDSFCQKWLVLSEMSQCLTVMSQCLTDYCTVSPNTAPSVRILHRLSETSENCPKHPKKPMKKPMKNTELGPRGYPEVYHGGVPGSVPCHHYPITRVPLPVTCWVIPDWLCLNGGSTVMTGSPGSFWIQRLVRKHAHSGNNHFFEK